MRKVHKIIIEENILINKAREEALNTDAEAFFFFI